MSILLYLWAGTLWIILHDDLVQYFEFLMAMPHDTLDGVSNALFSLTLGGSSSGIKYIGSAILTTTALQMKLEDYRKMAFWGGGEQHETLLLRWVE